eukprot:5897506-Lingulodinium_polyedra.AAC.1
MEEFHLEAWHVRLLAIVSMGMQLGKWSSHTECPVWGGPPPPTQAPTTQPQPEEGAQVLGKVAHQVSQVEEASAKDGAQQMRVESKDLKALRAACGNTLYIAAAVLAKDGLRNLACLIKEFTLPFYLQHRKNASGVRSEADTR